MNQGNHGMLQSNPQHFINGNQQHPTHHGHPGNDPSGVNNLNNAVHNSMTSSSSWGKCPNQQQQQGIPDNSVMMTPGDIHHASPALPSTNNSFGASSTFNHYNSQQQQQHCFYPPNQMEIRYNNSSVVGVSSGSDNNPLRTDNNTVSAVEYSSSNDMNSSSGFYDTNDRDCRQYYPTQMDHQQQQHHHSSSSVAFSYDQQGQMKSSTSSCSMMTSGSNNSSSNFYSYYNNQNSQYSHGGGMYPNHNNQMNSETISDESDFSSTHNPRTHQNSNRSSYFDHSNNRHQIVSDCSSGYFGYHGTQQQCGRYNATSSTSSHYNSHHHHHHPPFRRKSMESYISEPGDVRYNNSSSSTNKYNNCSNFSPSPQQQQQTQYCSPAPSPSSTSTMIKRECLSNPSSSMPVPLSNATNVNPSCSGWSPRHNNNNNNTTTNSTETNVQIHSVDHGHPHHPSQDYLYSTNSNSHQNQSVGSSNMNYNNNIPYNISSSNDEVNSNFHHQQQHTTSNNSFKSCVYEHTESKMDNEIKNNINIINSNFGMKAGSVKHRSLSLSIPLPSVSSYARNNTDINLSQQQHGNFTGHNNNSNDSGSSSSNSSSSGNNSNCIDSSEKVGESNMSSYVKADSHETFENYDDSPIPDITQSMVVEHNNQVFSTKGSEEECCSSGGQNNLKDQFSVESVEGEGIGSKKVSESQSESIKSCGGESAELCSSSPPDNCDDDDEISQMDSSLLLDSSAFEDLPESDMVIAEKSFNEDEHTPVDLDDDLLDQDHDDEKRMDLDLDPNNVISTTTNDVCHEGNENECDADDSECNSNNSNCSFTSALFGKRANSVSCNFSSDDNESCGSGGSLTFGRTSNKMSPQKISKRSFSETDKDMVINTTAMSFGVGLAFGRKNTNNPTTITTSGENVIVPRGWKREISYANNKDVMTVFYVSPSDTKLRSWEELKNYICSDGTCKCGLSCPLRLENAFNFDPKVISLCVDKGKDQQDLMYLTGLEEQLQHQPKSSLCNHYKRKIPKSEDSPLISSTRDDLGDCPEKRIKKRRTSESEFSTDNPGNATPNNKESPVPPSISRPVAVPCSQQSPDTTTQTPQTEMSPASSVSSEPSSVTNFNLTSTPTPPSSSNGKVGTPPSSKRQQGQCDFVWPPPPSTTPSQPLSSSSSNSTSNNNNTWTSPTTTTNTTTSSNTNNSAKKSTSCHHLITPKTNNKRANSPCPNIDVRQIPPEQNRPPPKPAGIEPSSIRMLPTNNNNNNAITTINPVVSSHPSFNANISFFPVTSTPNEMNNLSMNLNNGFTISPIVQPTTCNTMSILSTPQIGQVLSNNNMSCTIPLDIQKLIAPDVTNPANAFVPQFQSPVVFSMLGQPQQIITQKPAEEQVTLNNPVIEIKNPSDSSSAEKSPLQLVQDIVNRVDNKPDGESCNNKNDEFTDNEKRLQSDSSTGAGESTTTSLGDKDKMNNTKPEVTEGQITNSTTAGDKPDGSTTLVIVNANDGNNPAAAAIVDPQPANNKTIVIDDNPDENDKNDEVTIIEPNKVEAVTTVNTPTISIAPMDQSTVTTCVTSGMGGNTIGTFTVPTSAPQQIILQAPQSTDQNGGNIFSAAGAQPMRYIQTIQPFIFNSAGGPGGQLIISPQSHPNDQMGQQSFIYHDPNQQVNTADHGLQSMLQPTTTMLFDPNLCANNPNLMGVAGNRKKKKRLSKKQQQQQAQLQLQQQLLIQQIQQAQQQQAAASFPLIFPQSFNLGPQGFSLQPMNFFQTPTYLTLPNFILNPADGTLFLQPSAPLSTTTSIQQQPTTMKFPLTTTTTLSSPGQQIQQHPNPIAPKKDNGSGTVQILEIGKASSDAGSDDFRRNPTPDSSTGDIQQGILNASSTPNQTTGGNTIINIAPHPATANTKIAPNTNKKVSIKSRAVSSSSTVKRIYPQKQILPKIDSTTPSLENN